MKKNCYIYFFLCFLSISVYASDDSESSDSFCLAKVSDSYPVDRSPFYDIAEDAYSFYPNVSNELDKRAKRFGYTNFLKLAQFSKISNAVRNVNELTDISKATQFEDILNVAAIFLKIYKTNLDESQINQYVKQQAENLAQIVNRFCKAKIKQVLMTFAGGNSESFLAEYANELRIPPIAIEDLIKKLNRNDLKLLLMTTCELLNNLSFYNESCEINDGDFNSLSLAFAQCLYNEVIKAFFFPEELVHFPIKLQQWATLDTFDNLDYLHVFGCWRR